MHGFVLFVVLRSAFRRTSRRFGFDEIRCDAMRCRCNQGMTFRHVSANDYPRTSGHDATARFSCGGRIESVGATKLGRLMPRRNSSGSNTSSRVPSCHAVFREQKWKVLLRDSSCETGTFWAKLERLKLGTVRTPRARRRAVFGSGGASWLVRSK